MPVNRHTPIIPLRYLTRSSVGALVAAVLLGGGLVGCSTFASQSGTHAQGTSSASAQDASASSVQNGTPGLTTGSNSSSTHSQVPQLDLLREQAIRRVSPSVVEVQNIGTGLGSGVIVRPNGYIVTNHHVVSGAHKIVVSMANGKDLTATLVGTDPVDDLAVIKVNAGKLPAATLGNSSDLQVGESVLAIGNPLGITSTVTEGIVSALNRTVSEGQGGGSILNAVQTSAAINPGNSGGALINLSGQVIGIPTLTAIDPEFNAPASGVGFAIPSSTVKRIIPQIIKTGHVTHSGRAAIGVYAETVTPDLAAQYNLPVNHGVLVGKLVQGGGAAHAGMTVGDIIVAVNGKNITSNSGLLDVLASKKPGNTIHVTVVTPSGKQKTFTVTLHELQINSNG